MGEFFDKVVIFLEEYYVYVIGVGLIIILMLIGLIASRRKARKGAATEDKMANINDVSTGSINDVANTLQNSNMQPVDVVTAPTNDTQMVNTGQPMTNDTQVVPPIQPVANDVMSENPFPPVAPVAPEMGPIPTPENVAVEPILPVEPISPFEPIQSAVNEPATISEDLSAPFGDIQPVVPSAPADDIQPVAPSTPVDEEKFEKTEIIDFSTPETEKPVDINNNVTPFAPGQPQFSEPADILNGESSNNETPKF